MVLKDTHRASINIDKDNKIPVRVVHGNDAENIALYLAGDEYKDTRYNDVQVDFYDNMLGMVRTMCNVVIKRNPNYPSRMDEQWMGDCTIRTVQEIVQRQKDVRVNVSIEIPFSSEKRADFYGTVTNISAGGIFMITSEVGTGRGAVLPVHVPYDGQKVLCEDRVAPSDRGWTYRLRLPVH